MSFLKEKQAKYTQRDGNDTILIVNSQIRKREIKADLRFKRAKYTQQDGNDAILIFKSYFSKKEE